MKKEYTIIDTYIKTVSKEIRNRKIKRELRAELLSHIMEIYERNIALGMSNEDAQRDAVAHMGDTEAVAKTFKKLYPISSFDFLQNNMTRFVYSIAWSLFLLFSRAEPLNSVWFVYVLSIAYETLWHYRKVNKKFKYAHITAIFNIGFIIIFNFIYNYFALDYSFYKFIILGNAVISSIEYFFVFYGVKLLEKQLEIPKKDSRSPLISCGLLIITQFSVSIAEILNNDIIIYFLVVGAFFTSMFPLVMLGDTTELFEEIEVYTPKSKKERNKRALKEIGVWIIILLCLTGIDFISSNRPVKTTEFIVQDTTVQVDVKEIRENLISLGLPQNIADDLPDSEIIKYNGAEYMELNQDDSEYYKTEFNHNAYAFFMPENDLQPERVRILFVLDNFTVYEKLYRDGIYFWRDNYGVDLSTNYQSIEADSSFCQILCEIDGETQKVLPFYQKNKIYSNDLLHPIGCDFGFAKNGENHRIYISQTFIPNDSIITVGLEYYHTGSTYHSTRHAHYINEILNYYSGLGGTSHDSIRVRFSNPTYIEPEESEEPILDVPEYLDGSIDFEPSEEIDNIDELIEYYNP